MQVHDWSAFEDALRVCRIVESAVGDLKALCVHAWLAQSCGEVPHRREKQHRSRPMAGNVGAFFCNFHHDDVIVLRVGSCERGRVCVELVSEHDDDATLGA